MNYLRIQRTSARLISSRGAEYPLRRLVPGTEDPVEGNIGTPSYDEQEVSAVILPPSKDAEYYGEGVDLMKVWDILISPDLNWAPKSLDEVQYEGEWWTIDGLTPVKPDGITSLIFKAFLRRA